MIGPATRSLRHLLAGSPKNWGRWGDDDEVGALNLLGKSHVLRGIAAVRDGTVHTLQRPIGVASRELRRRDRPAARHVVHRDQRAYATGAATPEAGGLETAEDSVDMHLHGTTHVDALSHSWYDGVAWNGQPAESTNGGLDFADVLPLAEHGVVGRGVLLDVPRHRGVDALVRTDRIGLAELRACARAQGVTVESGDVLLVRTGWNPDVSPTGPLDEPGLEFHPDLVRWFHETEISCLVGDTVGGEATHHGAGCDLVLHGALMRNLGIVFTQLAGLDALAADCAERGQHDFLYMAAPLKIARASASPVNPIAVL